MMSMITIQRTSKPIKLIYVISTLLITIGILKLMGQQDWALTTLFTGLILGFIGRVAKWWWHE